MKFQSDKHSDHIILKATTDDGEIIPTSEWMAHASGVMQMAVARLRTLLDSGEAVEDPEGLKLSQAQVVDTPDHEAKALGLPASAVEIVQGPAARDKTMRVWGHPALLIPKLEALA